MLPRLTAKKFAPAMSKCQNRGTLGLVRWRWIRGHSLSTQNTNMQKVVVLAPPESRRRINCRLALVMTPVTTTLATSIAICHTSCLRDAASSADARKASVASRDTFAALHRSFAWRVD